MREIHARVCKASGDTLAVTFVLIGDLDRIRIPEPRLPRIGERLWEHTCCEIFITLEGVPAYHEFNFAPSGEWAAYAFERYREGAPVMDEALGPRMTVRRAAGQLEIDVLIRLDRLSPAHAGAKLRLALSAVIEDRDGGLTYWALAHPASAPDFHHPDSFTLAVP